VTTEIIQPESAPTLLAAGATQRGLPALQISARPTTPMTHRWTFGDSPARALLFRPCDAAVERRVRRSPPARRPQ
jgi:hypothetical protein